MSAPVYVLGFGSLIWDLDDLAPKVRGGWHIAAGPVFALEFSYVSKKRNRSLVVGIDPEHGAPCRTHIIESVRLHVPDAREDLAARERTAVGNIGWVDLRGDTQSNRGNGVAETVADWCRAKGAAGAVWTHGLSNFHESTGTPFTVGRGVEYLKTLTGDSLAEAEQYINCAPETTDTPLRRALAADAWWRGLPAVLRPPGHR